MEIIVDSIINIFTVVDGRIKLIVDKDNNLLKVNCTDDLDLVCNKYINDNLNINNLNLRQCYTFSKKEEDKYNITVLYVDIVNFDSIKLNGEYKLIDIDLLDNIYLTKSIDWLRKELVFNSSIKRLYSKEFILPEIQKIYEKLLNKSYDRRNFRKKLIKLDVIEDLNKYSSSKTGRPAKLYRFKDIKEDKILF